MRCLHLTKAFWASIWSWSPGLVRWVSFPCRPRLSPSKLPSAILSAMALMLLYNIFLCHSRPSPRAPCGRSDSTQCVLNTLSLLTKTCPGTLQSGVQTPVGAAPRKVLHHISSFSFDTKKRNITWIPKFAYAQQNSWFAALKSHPLIAETLNHLLADSET